MDNDFGPLCRNYNERMSDSALLANSHMNGDANVATFDTWKECQDFADAYLSDQQPQTVLLPISPPATTSEQQPDNQTHVQQATHQQASNAREALRIGKEPPDRVAEAAAASELTTATMPLKRLLPPIANPYIMPPSKTRAVDRDIRLWNDTSKNVSEGAVSSNSAAVNSSLPRMMTAQDAINATARQAATDSIVMETNADLETQAENNTDSSLLSVNGTSLIASSNRHPGTSGGSPQHQTENTRTIRGAISLSSPILTGIQHQKPPTPRMVVNPYTRQTSTTPVSNASAVQDPDGAQGDVESQQPRESGTDVVRLDLAPGLSDMEVFAGALLLSPPKAYVMAGKCNKESMKLWTDICARVGLETFHTPLRPIYQSADEHCAPRAALVLEEARAGITKSLFQRWEEGVESSVDIPVSVLEMRELGTGFTTVWMKKEQGGHEKKLSFTKAEAEFLRPGEILECDTGHGTLDKNSLLIVLPQSKKAIMKSATVVLQLFGPASFFVGSQCTLRPVSSALPLWREFVTLRALRVSSLPFWNAILRGAGTSVPEARNQENTVVLPSPCNVFDRLSRVQKKVVTDFLNSKPGSLTIVQGPPGTGKTTLLVALLRQCLANPAGEARRLMVCAPTNKAISVLALRFLHELPANVEPDPNIVIVGDDDKLLEGRPKTHPLRSFFLYTWKRVVIEEYTAIAEYCRGENPSLNHQEATHLAERLEARLKKNLRLLPSKLQTEAGKLCEILKLGNSLKAKKKAAFLAATMIENVSSLEDMVYEELLGNANIIFSTLCSAGSKYVSCTRPVDDLIVDEAAAATEPALYIPFRCLPQRLLVIGDPMQLPATVSSERAHQLGLATSLHERLMKKCKYKYTILEEQYRMHPEIAAFPLRQFYSGKIIDGSNVRSAGYGTGANMLPGIGGPYVFFQVHGTRARVRTGSLENMDEASLVVSLVRKLVARSPVSHQDPDNLRIITFYAAQVALISKLLKDIGLDKVLVSTVDSAQGCEADVVIVSFVNGGSGTAGFLDDDRRMNVALTRARHQLLCVGHVEAMTSLESPKARTIRLLCHDAMIRGVVQEPPSTT